MVFTIWHSYCGSPKQLRTGLRPVLDAVFAFSVLPYAVGDCVCVCACMLCYSHNTTHCMHSRRTSLPRVDGFIYKTMTGIGLKMNASCARIYAAINFPWMRLWRMGVGPQNAISVPVKCARERTQIARTTCVARNSGNATGQSWRRQTEANQFECLQSDSVTATVATASVVGAKWMWNRPCGEHNSIH